MINKDALITLFRQMYEEHWQYELGKAEKGLVDCSGAFVWAYKQFGENIYHGSNRVAREYVGPMVEAKKGKPGYAAFKWRPTGEPNEYKADGRGDYYHIGLIDETGRSVYNAKSKIAGFSKDDIGKWDFAAPLFSVEYEEIVEMGQGIVTTLSTPLNVRERPTTKSNVIFKLPKGAVVNVTSDIINGFYGVEYDGKKGYCSSQYITLFVFDRRNAKVVLNKIYGIITEYLKGEQHDD